MDQDKKEQLLIASAEQEARAYALPGSTHYNKLVERFIKFAKTSGVKTYIETAALNLEELQNKILDLLRGNDNSPKVWTNCNEENPTEQGYYFVLNTGNPKDILGSRPAVHFWDNDAKEWSSQTSFWLKTIS
jgi:hypothetical protein